MPFDSLTAQNVRLRCDPAAFPTLLTGLFRIARIIDAGLNAIRTSTVGTAQSLAHGASAQESLQAGSVAGATGAALEGAAAGVKALAPTVEKIAGVDVPVRASQRSKLAAVAENTAPGKALQKFDVQQTQPAAKKANRRV